MKTLQDIREGFFQNVGTNPKDEVDKWIKGLYKMEYHMGVAVDGDARRHHISIRIPREGTSLFLHNELHNTNRMDIEIDFLKEWENCFSELWNKIKDINKNNRWEGELMFHIMTSINNKKILHIYPRGSQTPDFVYDVKGSKIIFREKRG